MIESGFSPHALFGRTAASVRPGQFISSTGKRYSPDRSVDRRARDPLKSSVAAAMYLKELYDLFTKDWYRPRQGTTQGENKISRHRHV